MGRPRFTQLWDGCMGFLVQGGIPILVNGLLIEKLSKEASLTASKGVLSAMATGLLSSVVINLLIASLKSSELPI